jgi:hypothetical protein
MDAYLARKAVSSGLLHTLLDKSPLHARMDSPWNSARQQRESNVADIGTYAHACLLEGGTDKLVIVDADDWRTKAAREARDVARLECKLPILAGKMGEVHDMVCAAQEYIAKSELAGILDDGEPELTLLFEIDGVPCKARPDFLRTDRRVCLSYKTTLGSANPESWVRTQLPGYDVASVFYELAVREACQTDDACLLVHLVQEQKIPCSCSLVALSPAMRELAAAKMHAALATWKACTESGNWPAYSGRIHYAEPRPWQFNEFEEKQASTAFSEQELEGGIPL